MKKQLLTLVLSVAILGAARAYVRLPDILADSMVLQQGTKVPVWGKALPGEAVTVLFDGQAKSVKADTQGDWKVYLDPMQADATPQTMTITGINTIRLRGILVGEVWVCSGQSNMQLILARTDKGDSVVAAANDRQLRLFNVDRETAFHHHPGLLGSWQAARPASVRPFSAAAYYFGMELRKKLKVPVGIINASFGGSQAEAWTPVSWLHTPDLQPCIDRQKTWAAERASVQQSYSRQLEGWRKYAEKQRALGRRPREAPHQPEALRDYRPAGSIYTNMIAPVMPFAIKGNIWYQGESNEGRAEQYGILLPVMIRAWRKNWGEGEFPFGIVQLPNFRNPSAQPEDGSWSHLRDAQRKTADTVPNTGLIVTIDIGEAHNIHPHDKLDVGRRMCRWALADVYGKPLLPGGPVFEKATPKGSKMIVTFSVTGAGLRTRDGKAPAAFALAGADHSWHWAEAKITGKNTIRVWCREVKKPVAVRYAFNNNPQNPNLTNDSGVPASPFRSDDWPGPDHGKR
jgi:sialate O-acetylesterase